MLFDLLAGQAQVQVELHTRRMPFFEFNSCTVFRQLSQPAFISGMESDAFCGLLIEPPIDLYPQIVYNQHCEHQKRSHL